jgi:hypothetical protein
MTWRELLLLAVILGLIILGLTFGHLAGEGYGRADYQAAAAQAFPCGGPCPAASHLAPPLASAITAPQPDDVEEQR